MPSFSYEKQVKIVIATMALHNYIRRHMMRDCDFDESEVDSSELSSEEIFPEDAHEGDGQGRREVEVLRNFIAQSLMDART